MAGLQLLVTGVTLYAGAFHGAFARRMPASRWLTAWALVATGFIAARATQISTAEPEVAVLAARVCGALSPFMLWLLFRFIVALTGEVFSLRTRVALFCAAAAFSGLALFTNAVVTDRIGPGLDFFGKPYLAVRGGPGLGLLALGIYGALGWSVRALYRAKTLDPTERKVLISALSVYVAMATHSVFSSLGFISMPGLVEFGPLAIVLGTSLLAVNRERRLERELGLSIDEQTRGLHASEERYRSLVEHAPIGIVICDQGGNVLAMTDRFRSILGLREAGGTSPTNLFRDSPPRLAAQIRAFARTLAIGKTATDEVPFTTRGGRRVDLRVVIAPQRNAGGEPDGAMILAEDVTERRAVEARLRQSLKLEAIGQLAGGIATGVMTPMADARESLATLERGLDELRKCAPADRPSAERFAEIEELLAESREGVERAIAIVRDMRDLAQGGSPARDAVDVNELLAGVVRMAATRRCSGGIVERYVALPGVVGNAGQLRQVFLNLVVNALQAAGASGRVEVETATDRGGVWIHVRDDGPGIAAQHRERLFVPFFTTKPAGEGTGLGLYISYQIVQGHGGEIRVDSQPGLGATFSVWLPGQPATSEPGTETAGAEAAGRC